ncbi:MFS general substrate transporter [Athelia psychrophila]|uniref:MFS general substrate transporter n=1 Tax=Athelia psychrophila TaxID=1759441 RepID=A0A166MAM8_9AGAM|nr:MFS general substrate transporter [Fibularhizoctonia sp. CBS 109695]
MLVIYPFVNQLVRDTGITGGDQRKTGYFAGLIESAFYATEAICVLQWGRASDRLGRKPILLGGLLGMTLSMLGFGISRKFWSVVLARCAEGALCGNIGVCKGMIAELTDASNMVEAFAYLPMVWAAGATLGPLIGGLLARPAERWPETMGTVPFFTTYPYFLPCMVAACVAVSAFILAACLLKETLPPQLIRRNGKTKEKSPNPDIEKDLVNVAAHIGPTSMAASTTEEPQASSLRTLRSLLIRRIVIAIICYAFLAFIDQCMVVLQPLMYSSSISLGGLGFSSFTIGLIMGVWGVFNGVFSIFAFPRLLRIFGARQLFIAAFSSYLLCLAAFPILGVLARKSGRVDEKVWAVLIIQLLAYMVAYMSYGCIFVLVNEGAPRTALGALNGLAQTVASLIRAIAPSTASSLFSVSLEQNIIEGNMVYIILLAITLMGVGAATRIPKPARAR